MTGLLSRYRGTMDWDDVEHAIRDLRPHLPSDWNLERIELDSLPGPLGLIQWRAVASSPKVKDGTGYRAWIRTGNGNSPAAAVRDIIRNL